MLFSGTMRKNLDPFDDYSDEVLLKALENVELDTKSDGMGIILLLSITITMLDNFMIYGITGFIILQKENVKMQCAS